ncbi:MAG TPA: hypothetical protein VFX47_00405 [Gammaproteobacteria bacterium]|nr:hypothetical protein [Gammaproteobacteria bacterium]
MGAIVRTCWDICLLKRGPQVFPRSGILLAVMLLIYVLLDLYSGFLGGLYLLPMLLGETLLDTVMLVAFCYLVMLCWDQRARFNQTAVALLGTSALLMGAGLPLLSLTHLESLPLLQQLASWMLLLLFLWNIVVTAHILRYALANARYAPILLAAPYQLLNFLVLTLLFQVK